MQRHPVTDAEPREIAEVVQRGIARGAVNGPALAQQMLRQQAAVLARNAEDERRRDGPPRAM
jgi:hypothetical protein